MEQNYLSRAAKYLADLRKRKAWRKVVSGMGAVVVFCTVYALILPALTWARPVTCGQEEHVHDESCYASLPQESAGPAQMAAQTPAEPQCSVESIYEVAAPGQEHADFVLHTHGDECFLDGGIVICTLPTGFPLHVHDESCYTEQPVLVCGQEGAPEGTVPSPDPVVPAPEPVIHHHSDTCYTKTLICGQEEVPASEGHRHSDACYEITTETIPGELICGITDDPAHIHGEECYAAPQTVEQRKLICLLPESDPIPGHQHMDACWEQTLTCGKEEGQPEPIVDIMDEPVPAALGQETAAGGDASVPTAPAVHVHSESCYQMQKVLTCDKEQYTEHLHVPECYDENGGLTCGRLVTVSHVHTAECFPQPEQPGPVQPEEPERVLACGKEEHTHTDLCYAPEEPALPDNTQQKEQWDAIFWSNYVDGASDVVLDAQVSGTWSDTAAMDTERLTQLYAAPAEDLSRYLSQEIGIQVDAQLYHSELHGPMDADAGFSILLKWSHDEASFSTMTYIYQFPEQVVVADVERRILSDAAGPALAYSVAGNLLTVTYYAPAAAVEASFLLKAAWAPELGESAHIQWTPSTFTDVTFAKPELTVAKTMGEDGLRVMEDGTVWADYTVTVTNSGKVQAKEITFTDTLESQYFHFARGAFENGADYSLTVNTSAPEALSTEDGTPVAPGAEQFLTFENYDGGNVLTFPAFDLAAGESRVFQYKASMSSEDRERVDEAVEAARETASAPVDAFAPMALSAETAPGMEPSASGGLGETVRNTASVTCHALGEAAVTATSVGTYGGPERKHVEDLNTTYHGETFDVTFVVNGDARLPAGASLEKIDGREGNGFTLEIQKLPETDPDYITFAQALEEDGDSGDEEQLELQALRLDLRYNGVRLDLDDCEVTATVTPNEALKNYRAPKAQPIADGGETEEVLGDKGFGIELKAFTLEEQTDAIMGTTTEEVVERGSIYIDVPEETAQQSASVSAPVTVGVNSNLEDGAEPLTVFAAAARTLAGAGATETAETTTATASMPAMDGVQPMTITLGGDSAAFQTRMLPYTTYQVEFWGELELLKLYENDKNNDSFKRNTGLSIIDTKSLGRLPANGEIVRSKPGAIGPELEGNAHVKYLTLKDDGTVETSEETKQLFLPKQLSFNRVRENPLTLKDFAVLRNFVPTGEEDKNPNGETNYTVIKAELTKSGAQTPYKVIDLKELKVDVSEVILTNDESKVEESENVYYLEDGASIKLICEPTAKTGYTAPVTFYDYDISDGLIYSSEEDAKATKNGKNVSGQVMTVAAWANVNEKGINSAGNYPQSADAAKFAFGNGNGTMPTGLGHMTADGQSINQANANNFRNCSFGIVSKLRNGRLVYNNGIIAPKLFDEAGSFTGKTVYNGEYQLEFRRNGDTYIMTSVKKNGSAVPTANNLDKLTDTGPAYLDRFEMYSNLFWPMDSAAKSFGTDGHDFKFGSGVTGKNQTGVGKDDEGAWDTRSAPLVDPLKKGESNPDVNHNAYFGMQFKMSFTIPEDYVGPLEYCFFGDDDLWLFLEQPNGGGNAQLVCDIGGVHQAAGEYVDLSQYIDRVNSNGDVVTGDEANGKAYKPGTYTLHLYYTERGASGSTCWMQFTLPGLRSVPVDVPPDEPVGDLRIAKEVTGSTGLDDTFDFTLTLTGTPKEGGYDYEIIGTDGTTVETGKANAATSSTGNNETKFKLKAGQFLRIKGLANGMKYEITEQDDNNAFETSITQTVGGTIQQSPTITNNGKTITGTIVADGGGVVHVVTYTNTFHYTLPETGGPGTTWYTYGVLPALVAAVVLYKRSRKKGGTVS